MWIDSEYLVADIAMFEKSQPELLHHLSDHRLLGRQPRRSSLNR